jgi:hypothetical protein
LVGSGVRHGRYLHLRWPGADHDQGDRQGEGGEDDRELEGGRDAVGQDLVGQGGGELAGLAELGQEVGGAAA